jgi:hypothetical protein
MAEQQKIHLAVSRPGHPAGEVEFDGFVLVGWDEDEEGGKQVFTQSSSPPGEDADALVTASRALARAMGKHPHPPLQVIGRVMERAIEESVERIAAEMVEQGHGG